MSISGVKSVTMTRPDSPTRRAAMSPVSARPAPSSSTVSPGCGSSFRTIHSLTGREAFHSSSRRAYQPGATAFQAALLCWRAVSCCPEISPGGVMSLYLIVSLGYQDRGPTNSAQAVCVQTGIVAPLNLANAGRDVPPRPYCSDTLGACPTAFGWAHASKDNVGTALPSIAGDRWRV